MLLKNLLRTNLTDDKLGNLDVRGITHDSNAVKAGDAYFCLTDDACKAAERCKEALKNGASVAISGQKVDNALKVRNVRDVFAKACKTFYGAACEQMTMIGVTGTNGKTTTSHIIAEILNDNGIKTGVIGTNGVFYGGKHFASPLTTPDADFLHKTFKEMKDDGVQCVVMEVSAHAIDQKRTNGIIFDYGILTNVTQDHLDYFKTFDAYEQTKLGFFNSHHMKKGFVCADDNSARKLIDSCNIPIKSYGLFSPSDIFATNIFCSLNGSNFVANVCDDVVEIKTNLVGKYNVYNCLAAMGVCHEMGLDCKQLASGLNFMYPVEGRFNVSYIDGKYVVVDFAHSPDSLKNVLTTAKSLTDGKVFVVFGCGGNRDRDKRHKMGMIAERFADVVCLTDDNPRNENSLDIIADIEKGMNSEHFVEPDREKAIKKMIDLAEEGDIVIIAGKGAEKYQEIGDKKVPYNDFDVIYQIFKESDPERMARREYYDN